MHGHELAGCSVVNQDGTKFCWVQQEQHDVSHSQLCASFSLVWQADSRPSERTPYAMTIMLYSRRESKQKEESAKVPATEAPASLAVAAGRAEASAWIAGSA